ncbi:MAG: hypothetical protein WAX89_02870 [Alphaproteobacteria bacterium]
MKNFFTSLAAAAMVAMAAFSPAMAEEKASLGDKAKEVWNKAVNSTTSSAQKVAKCGAGINEIPICKAVAGVTSTSPLGQVMVDTIVLAKGGNAEAKQAIAAFEASIIAVTKKPVYEGSKGGLMDGMFAAMSKGKFDVAPDATNPQAVAIFKAIQAMVAVVEANGPSEKSGKAVATLTELGFGSAKKKS